MLDRSRRFHDCVRDLLQQQLTEKPRCFTAALTIGESSQRRRDDRVTRLPQSDVTIVCNLTHFGYAYVMVVWHMYFTLHKYYP